MGLEHIKKIAESKDVVGTLMKENKELRLKIRELESGKGGASCSFGDIYLILEKLNNIEKEILSLKKSAYHNVICPYGGRTDGPYYPYPSQPQVWYENNGPKDPFGNPAFYCSTISNNSETEKS